ncbi:2-amino-4-hydroxy-6-hydroxymethyldihydropteridine diphosphokinase [Sphingomonas pituitosa]|uniref:2-amino-4-hydroxy-6- hydroxymethyldihydropteridine diphosphokinase n=1 Tax=Sphingomonas pituitosa TaxID=99597 RepID=UPI0008350D67|nr:2-amino-4-hydroxy-6-hydroxymethyldihydropteridine diphosphokinase [Sphingomonas pituitosa]
MSVTSYIIALGSNRRGRHGPPRSEVQAALAAIGGVQAVSRIHETPPLGPSIRRFANAVAEIESDEAPEALLGRLKAIERAFGRRRGQRWGARVIDLDIVLWSGGCWASPTLTVPHPQYRARRFVLAPLAEIAPGWRDPVTGRTTLPLLHAVDRRRPCA